MYKQPDDVLFDSYYCCLIIANFKKNECFCEFVGKNMLYILTECSLS